MMEHYTDQNHFSFGYDRSGWFQSRQVTDERFVFKYGRAKTEIRSWREANRQACLKIRENFQYPLWVLFSGGSDSEACIRSFLEARVPIRMATLKMKGGLNEHDLQYVHCFSKETGLPVEFFELDVESFIQSPELQRITDPISCVSPILACHLWLADQLDGVPIIAQGECYLRKDVPLDYEPGISPYLRSTWRLVESERLCSLYRHFILKNRPAVPGFFQYTPEQIDSYLRFNPILSELVNDQRIGKLGTRTSKNEIVRQFYPEISMRPKFTGFEKIEALHDRIRRQLADRYPCSDQNANLSYGEVLEMVRPLA